MQRGVIFEQGYDGQPIISNSDKRALTLVSSGGIYSKESSSSREHALSLSNLEFQYIGYSDVLSGTFYIKRHTSIGLFTDC
jgi:FMN-dependent NADH-azoreductase